MQTKPNREQLTASYDWYRQMRETQPVFFDQNSQTWHIFRYADIAELLGISTERREDFKHWSDAFVSGDDYSLADDKPRNS